MAETIAVEVVENTVLVEIVNPSADTVDVVESTLVVVEVVTAGPQGIQGPRGVNAGTDLDEFELVAATDGAQSLTLPAASGASHILYINGLAQRRSSYTVSGANVTLPDTLNIRTGDVLVVDYAPT